MNNNYRAPRISTCLWYDGVAEQAATLYTSLVENSAITRVMRPDPNGPALLVEFTLAGVPYQALNGGPHFRLSPAVSLFVKCDGQAEVDRLWDALLKDGGQAQQCGWLTDRFGLSWQIVPAELQRLLKDAGPEAYARIMEAVMQMVKLDLPTLQKAYCGD